MIAVLHRNMTRSDVGNHLGNEERIIFRTFLLMKGIVSGFFLKGVQTTDTGSDDNTDAIFVGVNGIVDTRITDCLLGCSESILRIQIKRACFLAVEVLFRIKVLHFTGKLGLEL